MKKVILLVISLFVLFGIVLCLLFSWNSSDSINEQIVILSKIALQSIISGFVTFLGLYITITFNERQLKVKELINSRPRLFFETKAKASDTKERKKLENDNSYTCSNSKIIRTINCDIKNDKNCSIKNVYIKKSRKKNKIEINGSSKLIVTCELQLCNNSKKHKKFMILYEDVMGNKYKQIVKYIYLKNSNTYDFKTSEPKRRLL